MLLSSSVDNPLIEAWVATGMNVGVCTVPWAVNIWPARALPSCPSILNSNVRVIGRHRKKLAVNLSLSMLKTGGASTDMVGLISRF